MNPLETMVQEFEVDVRCPHCEARFSRELGVLQRAATTRCVRCAWPVSVDAAQLDHIAMTLTESWRAVAPRAGRPAAYPAAG
jgi:hypothetical protein